MIQGAHEEWDGKYKGDRWGNLLVKHVVHDKACSDRGNFEDDAKSDSNKYRKPRSLNTPKIAITYAPNCLRNRQPTLWALPIQRQAIERVAALVAEHGKE